MRITLYLLREGVPADSSALRKPGDFQAVALKKPPGSKTTWALYSRQAPSRPVGWLGTVNQIVKTSATLALTGKSAGAVLLVSTGGRAFAVTFGTGFHAVDQTKIEPDFGLRVAANSVDPGLVTLAEARGLGKGARNAVSSVPLPNRLYTLRLATDEEWIRRFAGQSVDKKFALTLSGADSLRMTIEGEDLRDLPATLRKTLKKYRSTAYKSTFPDLDNFRRLSKSDPALPTLEADVLAQVMARSSDVGFAMPDEFNFANVDHYEIKRLRKSVLVDDLSPQSVYGALDTLAAWAKPLEEVKVRAHSEGFDTDPRALASFVVADAAITKADGSVDRYVTTAGAWFKVDEDFAAELKRKVDAIPDVTSALGLPDWDNAWLTANVTGLYAEDRYNRHASVTLGHDLLDRKLYTGKAGERVEICDLLSPARELICVKRLDGSATMIHLFEQGAISASLLQRVKDYRDRVVTRLAAIGGPSAYGENHEWTVVFAIATSRPGPIAECLPFFARASLAANVDGITDKGFKVAFAKVAFV